MSARRSEGEASKGAGPTSEVSRSTQHALVEELRVEAQRRGVFWEDLVERAGLAKASKSRLRKNIAGIETIGRLRRAMDELAGRSKAESPSVEKEATATRPSPVPVSGNGRRWVVVQRKDRQLFFGIADADDDQVTATGRVRLDRVRPILASHADAATLASVGPSDRGIAGAEAPSALILEVAVVFDCSRAAVKAFGSRQ